MSRTERALRAIYDVRFLLSVVIVILLVAILIPIRQNRLTNDRLLETASGNKVTLQRIEDLNRQIQGCTDPKGGCSKANAVRLRDALKQIQRITVVANACAVIAQKDPNLTEEGEILKFIDGCIAKDLQQGGG